MKYISSLQLDLWLTQVVNRSPTVDSYRLDLQLSVGFQPLMEPSATTSIAMP